MAQTIQPKTKRNVEPSAGTGSGPTKSSKFESWKERIEIPRWAVYCQAALLGLIATTFFIFGMMVGTLTSGTGDAINATFDCRVVGSVAYRVDGDLRADEGAVVILLPKDKKPDARAPGESVNPGTFKPLDNAAIDRIHELGGAVVRANENGQFDVMIDANYGNGLEYYLLIVSKNQRGVDTDPMTKEQVATIGTFFMPVEDVVEDRSFYWMKFNADRERIDLAEVEFSN
jgi:hypothetical protein